MHIEVLVEDSSGERLISALLPKILGAHGTPHTWRLHAYKGIGRIPKGLKPGTDPAKRILLDQLPRLLAGYAKVPAGIDAIVIVLDNDNRECGQFLQELNAIAQRSKGSFVTLFRLAIEEIEAWYLGDREALLKAYPHAKKDVLERYQQDHACGTWELLADAIYPGGASTIKKKGWPLPGQIKHEWAERIGPLLEIERNASPSFAKLVNGLRRLTNTTD